MFIVGSGVVGVPHFGSVAHLRASPAILSKIPIWQKNCTLYLLYVF